MTERLFRARRGRGLVPVLVEEGLSMGDGRVSGQHAKRGRLARPVDPQQAETLTDREGALSYSSNVTEMHVTEEEGGVRASCSPQVKQPSPINYAAFHNVNYRHMHILYECILLLQYYQCYLNPSCVFLYMYSTHSTFHLKASDKLKCCLSFQAGPPLTSPRGIPKHSRFTAGGLPTLYT